MSFADGIDGIAKETPQGAGPPYRASEDCQDYSFTGVEPLADLTSSIPASQSALLL
jgi:hypothetical protein